MTNVLIIQYDRFNDTTKKLQEDVKCQLKVNLNIRICKLRDLIDQLGDNLGNGNYIGIFNLKIDKKIDNVLHIQEKQNTKMLHLINQAYLLLLERISPVITLIPQDISEDNIE